MLFWAELKKNTSYLWVLEKGGNIWGYICFWTVFDEAHLANIAVAPSVRRQGWATYMLRFCLRFLRRRRIKRLFLEVRESNLPALRLYKKLGFLVDGRRRGYYRDTKEDAILMSLDLTSSDLQVGNV